MIHLQAKKRSKRKIRKRTSKKAASLRKEIANHFIEIILTLQNGVFQITFCLVIFSNAPIVKGYNNYYQKPPQQG